MGIEKRGSFDHHGLGIGDTPGSSVSNRFQDFKNKTFVALQSWICLVFEAACCVCGEFNIMTGRYL